ncbi:UNVERIFIED_CONTAM: hypothetical protein QE387_002155 [Pseudacidovorax intermedius]|nr:hypothetical protein [Pseudacidovorax intermedius]
MNKGIFLFLVCISSLLVAQQKPVQIAFLSDVHFQDLYGSFSDNSFKGIINPKTGKPHHPQDDGFAAAFHPGIQ